MALSDKDSTFELFGTGATGWTRNVRAPIKLVSVVYVGFEYLG